MSLNISPDQQAQNKSGASLMAALYLLLGMIWPVLAHGQQVNDLTQMDNNANASKLNTDQQKKESSPRTTLKLRPEDTKKYQTAITSMEGKNGDDILKSMQASNAARLAKMPLERRKQVEDFQKKYQAELKASDANPQYKPLDTTMEKLHLHLLGLDRGDGKQMTAQQKVYFEHKEAQIRQKYFDPARREKNRRMTVSDRYGPDARTVSEAESKRLQESARNGKPVASASNAAVTGTAGAGKVPPEELPRKASSIPGL